MVSMLLVALVVGLCLSILLCALALGFFPWFRSGERKPGAFRPDQSSGNSSAVVVRGKRGGRARVVRSSELPLVGGVAMIGAVIVAAIGTGVFLDFDLPQWQLLALLLGSIVGFGFIGFLDDWSKVHHGNGISERAKALGVLVVSLAAAIALNRLIPSARFAYSPYKDVPLLGGLLVNAHYAWIAFFVLMTVTVCSTTSLAVDFTDGLDGLSGGLLVSAALSFAGIIIYQSDRPNWPGALVMLAMVGALLGYLPFNWPSAFKAHGQGRGPRRARLIMGDTGALGLGGALALVAVVTRLELLLLFIGGVFVLEGVSALISARILVKFFRRFLSLPRYGRERAFAHTEFPLPFLATPMHHHYDLLGWDREHLVYGAWTLGAGLATLGVASSIAPFTWERYLARFVALVIILLVWQTGPWTRSFFIGLVPPPSTSDTQPSRLGLFYGFPYRLFGRPLYHRVDTVDATEDVLDNPAERMSLWQRTSVFDARAVLGYFCYRAGKYRDALRVWERIPQVNLKVRPEIADLLAEVRHQVALEAEGEVDIPSDDQPLRAADTETAATGPIPPVGNASAPHWPRGADAVDGQAPWQDPTLAGLRGTLRPPADLAARGPQPDETAPPPLWTASEWASIRPPDADLALPAQTGAVDANPDEYEETVEQPSSGLRPPLSR
ncbi:MAG: hypothetical protein PVSMB4_06970 [Ktedonobacterales bacterium]